MSQRTVARPQVRPEPLLQLWRIGLNPGEEGRVVHLPPTVLQHQLEIAVADREHQVPAHGPQDHLSRELPTLELFSLRHAPPPPTPLSRRPVYPIRTLLANLKQIPHACSAEPALQAHVPSAAIDRRTPMMK